MKNKLFPSAFYQLINRPNLLQPQAFDRFVALILERAEMVRKLADDDSDDDEDESDWMV